MVKHRYTFPITIGDHITGHFQVTGPTEMADDELENERQRIEKKLTDFFTKTVEAHGGTLVLGPPIYKRLRR